MPPDHLPSNNLQIPSAKQHNLRIKIEHTEPKDSPQPFHSQ